jgi:hypothetical protein
MLGRDKTSHGAHGGHRMSPQDRRAASRRLDAPPSQDALRRERSRRLTAVIAALERTRPRHYGH